MLLVIHEVSFCPIVIAQDDASAIMGVHHADGTIALKLACLNADP